MNLTTTADMFRNDHVEQTDTCQEFSELNSDLAIYMCGSVIPKVELSAIDVTMGSTVLKSCLREINVITKEGTLQESGPLTLVVPSMKYLHYSSMSSEALFFSALTGLNYALFEKYFTVLVTNVTSPEKVRVMA